MAQSFPPMPTTRVASAMVPPTLSTSPGGSIWRTIAPGWFQGFVPGLDKQVARYLATPEPMDKHEIFFNKSGIKFADTQMASWETSVAGGAKHILALVPPPRFVFALEYGTKMYMNAVAFKLKQ
ncbi:Aste57867_693 [Aphanomyces stellatus]|uniref:Aste57867_693 protein n=1 Tax=Aphanomyces stellatus TaxID=120398 RepID=A0A485K4A3_9STRA|nr:hypothetical protein As57867_000692 [Aphanomyces stellatus]VFT77918.1 Aste57867_693 [Aphanomyces stellatus]